jgi:putative membrane protein
MNRAPLPKTALAAAIAALSFTVVTAVAQTTGTQSGSTQKSGTTPGAAQSPGSTAQKSGTTSGSTQSAASTSGTATKSGDTKSASDTKSSGKSGSLQGADRTFMLKAAQGGMAEVEAGKVAQSKAQNDAVKQFAQRMVTDHSKANDELMSLAKSKNVDVPSSLDKQHQAHMDKMNKLSGPQFDREYMKHMVDDHKKTVADFEKQAKGGKDNELKSWADSKLPTLREHLKMAQSTHDQVAKGASDTKSGGKSDQGKAVNTGNPTGTTQGSNTGNTAGAAPKPATTGSGK